MTTAKELYTHAREHKSRARYSFNNPGVLNTEAEVWYYLLKYAECNYDARILNLSLNATSVKKIRQRELWQELGTFSRNAALMHQLSMHKRIFLQDALKIKEVSHILECYTAIIRREMKKLKDQS